MADGKDLHPALRALRAVGRALAVVLVAIWAILYELLFPIFRPLVRWLSGLRLFAFIGAVISRSPPYLVLLMLAVPFVVLEPLKVFALYWIAVGHVVQGTVLLIFAHVLSIFTLDRIYHTGHGQLMRIGWFARLMGWVVELRNWALGWVTRTPAWRSLMRFTQSIRTWFRGLAGSPR
ncbi:MAG TPA: hypothetical protein VHZ56_00615 [Devosia sp.]|nr:hypothetical protein [Devosia sp.]